MTVICWRGVRSLGVRALRPNPQVWLRLLRASLPFGIIGFALGLSYKFDTLLLNIYRGDAETGFYNSAYNLVFTAVLISNVLNTALYPSLSRQSVNQPEKLIRSYERALRYLMMASLPIAVGVWALAAQVVPFIFTDAFSPATPALKIVIWVVPLMFASEFFGYIVLISGKESLAARAVLVSTALNILFNAFLVPRYGLLAAAAMTVATEAVLVGQYVWLLRGTLRQVNLRDCLILPLLASVIMGAVTVYLTSQVSFMVNIPISMVVYFTLLFLFKVINRDEWRFVRSLRGGSEELHSS